jgi:hypothetical protein
MVGFGINMNLQTSYLLLKGMRTLNLIDTHNWQVTYLRESKLNMIGWSNSLSYASVDVERDDKLKRKRLVSVLSVEKGNKLVELLL